LSDLAGVLNRAADLIELDGWCQHDYRGRAIADAMGIPPNWWETPLYLEAVCALREVTGSYYVSGWNDDPGRRQVEVVRALRTAASRVDIENEGAAS
jgi:hypothetical protein